MLSEWRWSDRIGLWAYYSFLSWTLTFLPGCFAWIFCDVGVPGFRETLAHWTLIEPPLAVLFTLLLVNPPLALVWIYLHQDEIARSGALGALPRAGQPLGELGRAPR